MTAVRLGPVVPRVVGGALVAVLVSALAAPAGAAPAATPGRPDALTVDGLTRPIGLAPTDVQFAWHVGDTRTGAVQSSYRIVVRTAPVPGGAAGAPVWGSGIRPT